jgi:hypothetical protein
MSGPGFGQHSNPFTNNHRYPDNDGDSDIGDGYGSSNASTTRLAGSQPYHDQPSELTSYEMRASNPSVSDFSFRCYLDFFVLYIHFSTLALSP